MPERLTPPIRYPDPDDRGRKARRGKRAQQPQGGEKIVRPKKGLGFKDISKSDIFVTGAFDVPFFALTIIILAVGLVMLFSASYPYSYFESGNSYHYFIRQLIFAVLGIAAMLFISKLNYKIFKAAAPILLGVTIFLLVLVLFYHTSVSSEAGEDFRRYIPVGVRLSFKPIDIFKLTLFTLLLAYYHIISKYNTSFYIRLINNTTIIAH